MSEVVDARLTGMDGDTRALWERLVEWPLAPVGAVVAFEDKLVAETAWTRGHCQRVVMEYRRFLLLAARAGHPVSPSADVDRAWHLHLLYTRSYWDELCPKVLGFPLHHEPATGTPGDREKLDDWYARTLSSYERLFGQAPPVDIWPARAVGTRTVQVDPARSIVLPRRVFWVCVGCGAMLLLCVLVLAIM